MITDHFLNRRTDAMSPARLHRRHNSKWSIVVWTPLSGDSGVEERILDKNNDYLFRNVGFPLYFPVRARINKLQEVRARSETQRDTSPGDLRFFCRHLRKQRTEQERF